MTIRRVFSIIVIALVFLVSRVPGARAQDNNEFTTSVRSRYRVLLSGNTEVLHEIRLTNLTSLLFVSEYSMKIGGENITNIRAVDDVGTLPVVRSSTQNTTTILVNLESRPQLGVGRSKTFSVKYTSFDTASIVGSVLEVNVPNIRDATSLSSSQMTIETPSTFGRPTRVTPNPDSVEETAETMILEFTDTKNEGVSVLFGSSQTFAVQVSYILDNTGDDILQRTVTLVPDTPYQRVTTRTISPSPERVTSDTDGNWLAEYEISPHQKLRVSADLVVETFTEPTVPVGPGRPEKYLQSAPFWDVDDPEIRSLARSLQTPRAIFQFVTSRLTYAYGRIDQTPERRGALAALANPTDAICTEFTDLFITLARAAGVPARELNGFAYSENPELRPLSLTKDILHAWPEYWDADRAAWIPVDPTWTKTTGGVDYFSKLDLNHIVFAIHGTSSTEPLPAGFFTSDGDPGKTVFVTPVATPVAEESGNVSLQLSPTTELPSFRPSTLAVSVKNTGARALYNVPVTATHAFQMLAPPVSTIPSLLPGENRVVTFVVKPRSWWKREVSPLVVTIGDTRETFTISASPTHGRDAAVVGVLALAGAATLAVALRARRLPIRR